MQPYHRPAIAFLLKHLLYGTVAGVTLGALILWFDFAGLATMIFASSEKYLFLTMLFFGLWITFGGIGMAVGIMNLGEERDSDPF
jgi:hypothetical protein